MAEPRLSASEALYNFRLLAALRSDDLSAVQPFLLELAQGDDKTRVDREGQLLGMAIKVASAPVLHHILTSSSIFSPNVPIVPGSSTTALHAASGIGRMDAVKLLLNDPRTNDTLRDGQGRTPLECAANQEISSVIEESRLSLQQQFLTQLGRYVASPLNSPEESAAMAAFLDGPRAEILNLSALEENTGTSVLHEAARRRDLRLVELAIKRGADPFVRDKRGKRVQEGEKNADDRIKVFLRQFTNQDNIVQPKSDGRPPDLKGYLSKWTNYKSGWRTRWFVLENGVLSYYRNREDEGIACRGSIAMTVATLHPNSDGSRFEVHSKANTSVPKFIVKSSHRAEIARWVQTIKLNIDYQGPNVKSSASTTTKRTISNQSSERPAVPNTLPPSESFLNPAILKSATGLSDLSAVPRPASIVTEATLEDGVETLSILEAADNESMAGRGDQEPLAAGMPHEAEFDMAVLNIKAQIDLTIQLVDSIVTPPTSPDPGAGAVHPLVRTQSRQQAVKQALRSSLSTLSSQITHQHLMSQDRERYLIARVQREVEARRLWEDNMLAVAKQQAEMDEQLNLAARDNEKKRKALRQARGVLSDIRAGASMPSSPAGPIRANSSTGILDNALKSPGLSADPPGLGAPSPGFGAFGQGSISNMQDVSDAIAAADADNDSDEDDADEFFDAIEQNTITNLSMHETIAHPDTNRPGTPMAMTPATPAAMAADEQQQPEQQSNAATIAEYLARQSLQPYQHVRHRLPIDDDKRPSVSLWSILKSSVGKDLTKISFPVSFNECTSMLQRMAEDMEYDACLTVAAGEQDSLKRLAFVAAFAMSNYSSTIGRIAKPFNPLLSQSFEYAIPSRYRYISEQVSHHPPISACYCEAPSWRYFGEVDAQNKFQGRSFEIRPTGVAHAELVIPGEWVRQGLEYPAAGNEYGSGKVVEHYSWKKVTTNVSNFIMGNPIIDHYGDLAITNHRTGETCTLTFKPRTWRGKDAFEIRGAVKDAAGKLAWDIAGRWDSQLIARRAGSSAPLEVDTHVGDAQKEYMLLWRNSEKPTAPFNLTPYAITLNDIPQGLERYLCPTDCRLRTDQRAFENAEYDRAQALKTANEEKQRTARKLRAEGKLPAHEPRWFRPSTDADTQERLWEPRRAKDGQGEVLFWNQREQAGKQGGWSGVESIFATDDDL